MSKFFALQVIHFNKSLLMLITLVIISAVAVFYTKHVGRTEFIKLQQQERQRDHLNEEWGRLLIEQSTWARPGRVERQARERLGMIVPTADMTVMVKL